MEIDIIKMQLHNIIPTVFDDSMSYLELLSVVLEKINEVVIAHNDLQAQIDLVNLVKETIDDLTNNRKLSSTGDFTGTWNGKEMSESSVGLETLFNNAKGNFPTLETRLDASDEAMKLKAFKTDIFSMANMGQDIREAMTGGTVGVVGGNSVSLQQFSPAIQDDISQYNEVILNITPSNGYKIIAGVATSFSSVSLKTSIVECVSGDKFSITLSGWNTSSEIYGIAFVDNSYNLKVGYIDWRTLGSTTQLKNTIVNAPTGSNYMLLTCNSSDNQFSVKKATYINIASKNYVDSTIALNSPSVMISNNLQLIANGYTIQNISDNYTTNLGYPIIVNNIITDYGTQTYWYRKEVPPVYGTVVTLRVAGNVGIRAYIYYLNDSNMILKDEIKGSATLYKVARYPITPPIGCTKVLIMSSSNSYLTIEIISPNSTINNIPSYYPVNFLETSLSTLKQQTNFLHGICFAFITDLHFRDNSKNSKYLLKNILDNSIVPFVICGGDFTSAYGTQTDVETAENSLVDYRNYVGSDRFFTIRGNHDFTIKTSNSESTGYTAPYLDTYNFIARQQEKWTQHMQIDNMCYFLENESQKTRIICLNSCDGQSTDTTTAWGVYYSISQNQVDWLLNDALSKDGYNYIFISHIPADNSIEGYSSSQDVFHAIAIALKNHTNLNYTNGTINAIKDFTTSTSKMVCHVSGHVHKDLMHVDNNLLTITTTSDAHYTNDGEGAIAGTISEQAFDIFCFNYDTNTYYIVRVGRGIDRSGNY